jgi:hypothetical protein
LVSNMPALIKGMMSAAETSIETTAITPRRRRSRNRLLRSVAVPSSAKVTS